MSNSIDVVNPGQSKVKVVPKKNRPYIYHINTRNLSFLQTAKDLKELGIKNYKFFLKLYDKSLEFVNPHDPLITEEMAIRVMNECVRNPWYFLRECVRIPDQGGTGIPYQLHRANLALTFCFLNGIDHYLVIPRQKGKTMSAVAAINWAFLFGTTNSEMMFINKRAEDAANNLSRLKDQRDLLPAYMRMREIVTEEGKIDRGKTNVKSLTNPVTNNSIVTKPSASSVEKAEGLGRGCTQPIQYYDEVEFTPFVKTIIEAAGPAFNTASRNAKRNNAAYCRIFTSTPGDLDTQPGQDGMKIIENTCKWTEKFYDWSKDEIDNYIQKNSKNSIVYIEYNYKQLGEDEEWFQAVCKTLLNNAVKIKREIFLQRMRGSSESPFEAEELEAIQELVKKPVDELFINGVYKVDIYKPLDPNRIYFVSCDCGAGLGRDNSAMTILDPYELEPVAEFKSPYIGTFEYAKFLRTIVRKHIPKAILMIERNNIGTAIIQHLMETEISHRIYFDDTLDTTSAIDKLDPQGFLKQEALRRRTYGIWTGSKSRDIMFSLLEAHVKEYKDKFVTENITNDLLSLVRKKSGKIEHAVGFHDDSLMSYLIGLYVYYHGKNLIRYGFERGVLPDEESMNQGLNASDVIEEMPEEMKGYFEHTLRESTVQSFEDRMKEEIENNRRLSDQIDIAINSTHSAVSYANTDPYEDDGDDDLFEFLNN